MKTSRKFNRNTLAYWGLALLALVTLIVVVMAFLTPHGEPPRQLR